MKRSKDNQCLFKIRGAFTNRVWLLNGRLRYLSNLFQARLEQQQLEQQEWLRIQMAAQQAEQQAQTLQSNSGADNNDDDNYNWGVAGPNIPAGIVWITCENEQWLLLCWNKNRSERRISDQF